MKKSTITKIWLGGMVAIAIGFVTAGLAVAGMLAYGGTFTASPSGAGYDFVPSQDAFFWTMVSIIVAGGAVAAGGAIVQLVAWVGALVNSYQLPDKVWFLITLIGGLIGFGLLVMIAYLIAAPDGYRAGQPIPSRPAPGSLATTS